MVSEMVAAVVVAGGGSRRMGFDKLWADLGGRPVFLHSLETLQASEKIGQIVLVAAASRISDFREAVLPFSKVTAVISGGTERHLSVMAGLEKVEAHFRWIAVHDAARPLLSVRDLQAVIAAARIHGAACLATPVTDSLQRANAEQWIVEGVRREQLWAMQTPQVFAAERLRAAYERALATGEIFTDEASAVAKTGDAVKLIPAQDLNFKITYSCDIDLARAALSLRAPGEK